MATRKQGVPSKEGKKKEAVCELCGEVKPKKCKCKEHKPLKIKFCPECRATDVKFVFNIKSLFGLLPRVECMKCGAHAPDFPIAIIPAKKKTTKKKMVKK